MPRVTIGPVSPAAYLLHVLSIGQLYVVAFCVGAISVFFDVASPSYLPSLVAREDLARANGRLQVSEQGAAVFGPGMAGWLVGLIGAPLAIAADAASYLASAVFITGIRHGQTLPQRRADRQIPLRSQVGQGIRQVAASRQLRSIAITSAVINLFGRLMVVLVPLYLVREAGYRPAAIGAVFAAGSVGFLIGAAATDRVAARIGLGRAIVVGGTVASLALLLIAVPPPRLAGPFIAAAMFIYGLGALTFHDRQCHLASDGHPERAARPGHSCGATAHLGRAARGSAAGRLARCPAWVARRALGWRGWGVARAHTTADLEARRAVA